jgi:dihydroflavonol-4-reductase
MTQLLLDYCHGRLPAAVRGGYDFVDVRDVADGIVSCCTKGKPGAGYILAGKYVSVSEMVEIFHTVTGRSKIKIFLPVWVAKAALPFFTAYYNLMKQPPLFSAYSLYTLTINSNFSHEKAAKELGYSVRPFVDTVRDTVKWLKAEGRI